MSHSSSDYSLYRDETIAEFFLRNVNGNLIPLFPGPNNIGRDPSRNQIVLHDPRNSKSICVIFVREKTLFIRLLTSRPMHVNDRVFSGQNAELELNVNDLLRFHGAHFCVLRHPQFDGEDDYTEDE